MDEPLQPAAVRWNWRLAGLLHRLPEFRGRDRLSSLLLGRSQPPEGTHEIVVGPDLRFEACYRNDGSFVDLFFAQYQEPSLVPVLEAALAPGGTFFDVGANIGIYAGWAARLVGEQGRVHAFEPVPATREILTRFVAQNHLHNLRIVPLAVGAARGKLTLHLVPQASGLASAVAPAEASERVSVPMTSLDEYVSGEGCGVPHLIKIDVEGYEFEVIRGARALLTEPLPPAILFESHAGHLERGGVNFADLVGWFERQAGYKLFALTPGGLRRLPPATPRPLSLNSLALHPEKHAAVFERLRSRRFRRNQGC